MPLPECLELVPLKELPEVEIGIPGSKSITNRALILAALGRGRTVLKGALWSEDTQIMVSALQRLGVEIQVDSDPGDEGNREIRVQGMGDQFPRGGTPEAPLEIYVGNAGTAARFLLALVCLGKGVFRLSGVPRMHERPQKDLIQALRHLGYRIDSERDRLPAMVYGDGPKPGKCKVLVEESSQFASALLLSSKPGNWEIEVDGENDQESPYIEMTHLLMQSFPSGGGEFQIEPDSSSGSYFWGAQFLLRDLPRNLPEGRGISVAHWPKSTWQVDSRFPAYLPLPASISRQNDLGDSIMTAIVLAGLAGGKSKTYRFEHLKRLRLQECDRVHALATELCRCGGKVEEFEDQLLVEPRVLHGGQIETYHDHRMAMCFAMLGLKVPGIRILDPSCVKKTFPTFFKKLAAPPPYGLGVRLLDGSTAQDLAWEELIAD